MRQSEVNRMLGKVDELSVEDDNVAIPFTMEKLLKLLMVHLMDLMVLLKK